MHHLPHTQGCINLNAYTKTAAQCFCEVAFHFLLSVLANDFCINNDHIINNVIKHRISLHQPESTPLAKETSLVLPSAYRNGILYVFRSEYRYSVYQGRKKIYPGYHGKQTMSMVVLQ